MHFFFQVNAPSITIATGSTIMVTIAIVVLQMLNRI